MKTLRERLRYAWEKSGKTQTQIAEDCGVARAAVSQWVADDDDRATEPTRENLMAYAKSTGFALHWLLTGDGPELHIEVRDEYGTYGYGGPINLQNLAGAIEIAERKLPPERVQISARERAKIIAQIYSFLKPDGSLDMARVLDVVTPVAAQLKQRRDESRARKRKGSS